MPPARWWRRLSAVLAGFAAYGLATHVVLPGIDFPAFRRFIEADGAAVRWSLYDLLSGGGLHRASIAALGFLPYATASVMAAAIARLVSRSAPERLSAIRSAFARAPRHVWRRGLTLGISLIQAAGLAVRLQASPGVVVEPGNGFLLRTVLMLTATAIGALMLSEAVESLLGASADPVVTARRDDADAAQLAAGAHRASGIAAPAPYEIRTPSAVRSRP